MQYQIDYRKPNISYHDLQIILSVTLVDTTTHTDLKEGDFITMEHPIFEEVGIKCVIQEIKNGWPWKIMALNRDAELAKCGWFEQDGEYVFYFYELHMN